MEDETLKVKRMTRSVLKPNLNQVEVNFANIIEDKRTNKRNTVKETHNMRYFFLPELEEFLKNQSFSFLHASEWITDEDLSLNSWNGVIICKK